MTEEPEFIKSEQYYFDVLNNRIYGKEYKSRLYFHELSHYKDHKKKWYNTVSVAIEEITEFISLLYIVSLIVSFMFGLYEKVYNIVWMIGFLFFPIAIWRTQEEVRATINSYRWFRKLR